MGPHGDREPSPSPREGSSPRTTPKRKRILCPEVARICRRVSRVFASLDKRSFLGPEERAEFRYYEGLFSEALEAIDDKVGRGLLRPINLEDFPRILRYPGYEARVGIFIGSFDPFQMTHLATALRFLASPTSEADFVLVVPEGRENPTKPNKTEYRFRYELVRLQLEGLFSPLIVPLDIGANADTIGIVERLIELHAGAHLKLTHLLGSDALPTAALLLPEDLLVWRETARRSGVELDHGLFVALREGSEDIETYAGPIRHMGLRFSCDQVPLGTPSSTDFRRGRHITIAFPSEALLARLELLFRYDMNRPWMRPRESRDPDYQI